MKRLCPLAAVFLGLAAGSATATQKDHFPGVLEGFGKSLSEQADLDPELKQQLAEIQNNAELEAGGLTGMLRELHPDFGKRCVPLPTNPRQASTRWGNLLRPMIRFWQPRAPTTCRVC